MRTLPPPVPLAKAGSGFKAFSLAAVTASADTYAATVAWNANPEFNIAGYKVHYGRQSRSYTSVVDAGNRTSQNVSNLQANAVYYFAATAYNSLQLESDFSAEVSLLVVPPPPEPVLRFLTNVLERAKSTAGPWTPYTNVVFQVEPDGFYRVLLRP